MTVPAVMPSPLISKFPALGKNLFFPGDAYIL